MVIGKCTGTALPENFGSGNAAKVDDTQRSPAALPPETFTFSARPDGATSKDRATWVLPVAPSKQLASRGMAPSITACSCSRRSPSGSPLSVSTGGATGAAGALGAGGDGAAVGQ